jgi:hypothetical protein
MKAATLSLLALLALLAPAACATATDPETSTTEAHATTTATTTGSGTPGVNTSCRWVPGGTCYGMTNDGNNIWPTGVGITSVQVLIRRGPTRLSGSQQTFLAFVIWNKTTIGRIFRVDIGSDGVNWRETLSNVTASRTFGNPDFSTGTTGTASGGPVNPPTPHVNIENQITFDDDYLAAAAHYAGIIDDASRGFVQTPAAALGESALIAK